MSGGMEEVMSQEQAADLAALESAAMSGEAADLGADAGEGSSQGEQWAMVPAMIGAALAMALPDLKEVYSESACRAWGDAMVPVAEKYGWNADALACPEVGLLCASLPLLMGTVGAVQKHKAAALAAPDLGKSVHAGTVSFGEPVPA